MRRRNVIVPCAAGLSFKAYCIPLLYLAKLAKQRYTDAVEDA